MNPPLDVFTQAYIEAALWSTIDDLGVPLDKDHTVENVEPETLVVMIGDCQKFQKEYGDLIAVDVVRAGHDFWLTRNHHGSGFWDGDWPEEIGAKLTTAAMAFGEFDLWAADGKVHH